MSLGVSGAAIPPILGGSSLRHLFEWVVHPHFDQQDTNWAGQAIERGVEHKTYWILWDGIAATVRRGVDNWVVLRVRPSLVASCRYLFTLGGGLTTFRGAEINNAFPPHVLPAHTGYTPWSASLSAWIRKQTGGAATHSRQHFGFACSDTTSLSSGTARVGLVGDGATGYRFGSVNCPIGVGPAGNNGPADIDANSIAPAELVNPGALWFHVRIRMIPATPISPPKWVAYLNGRVVKVFDNPVNFPRGNAGIDGFYGRISPSFGIWFDAAQIDGFDLHDMRYTIEEDVTV